MFRFDPEWHTYYLGAERLPSVTKVLSVTGVSPSFDGIDPAVLVRARNRGVAVHQLCEDMDNGVVSEVEPELSPYVRAYSQFLADTGAEVVAVEARMCCLTHKVAGTMDRVYLMRGALVMADLKATFSMAPSTAIQTAAYSVMWDGGRFESIPGADNPSLGRDPIKRRAGLHLRRNGTYELHPYNDRNDFTVWAAAVALFRNPNDENARKVIEQWKQRNPN